MPKVRESACLETRKQQGGTIENQQAGTDCMQSPSAGEPPKLEIKPAGLTFKGMSLNPAPSEESLGGPAARKMPRTAAKLLRNLHSLTHSLTRPLLVRERRTSRYVAQGAVSLPAVSCRAPALCAQSTRRRKLAS